MVPSVADSKCCRPCETLALVAFADSCTVETEDDRQVEQCHVVNDVVVSSLCESAIDIAERDLALFGQSTAESHSMFFGNADIVELDKQGRFTIKAELLQYANLSKDVVIAGSGNKFEVWNAEDFERDTNKTRDADDLNIEVIF